jgi:hypothetical protein
MEPMAEPEGHPLGLTELTRQPVMVALVADHLGQMAILVPVAG